MPDDALVDATCTIVRLSSEDDLPELNDIYNHYVRTSHVTFDIHPTSMESRRLWLAKPTAQLAARTRPRTSLSFELQHDLVDVATPLPQYSLPIQ